MITQDIHGHRCQLQQPFDLSFLERWGRVFQVFDQQDSGNLCFGVERDGSHRFIKFAGTQTLCYHGNPQDAIDHLKRSAQVLQDLAHPTLLPLLEAGPIAGGYALVFPWTDAICMGKQYPTRRQFLALPLPTRLKIYRDILDFHCFVDRNGYVCSDFYDGSILYDLSSDRTLLCDLDEYRPGPFVNTMGRMYGSTRFMAPEEFTLGEMIDRQTMVYTMGATGFALLAREGGRSRADWPLSDRSYDCLCRAVSDERQNRYSSPAELLASFEEAL